MGDRIAVLKDGVLRQLSKPRELYTTPQNAFVASFIGSPAMNVMPTAVVDGGARFGSTIVPLERKALAGAGPEVLIGVRPDDLVVSDEAGDGIILEVDLVEELGADGYLYGHFEQDGERTDMVARVNGADHPNAGATVSVTARPGHLHVFSKDTGLRLNGPVGA